MLTGPCAMVFSASSSMRERWNCAGVQLLWARCGQAPPGAARPSRAEVCNAAHGSIGTKIGRENQCTTLSQEVIRCLLLLRLDYSPPQGRSRQLGAHCAPCAGSRGGWWRAAGAERAK